MSLRPGTTLGSYRIVAPLGAGGMGVVYKASDLKLDRSVAIKILPPEMVRDPDRVRRFVQEARSASSLSHPNVVTIYDIGETVPTSPDGEPEPDERAVHFIAMELVEGVTLRQLLADRSVTQPTLLAYLAQAADGLAKAHEAGIVHRDLKPENVMVTRDGFAKVLDFGLAKLTERSSADEALTAAPTAAPDDLTHDGAVVGTVGYMSPEQAMGRPVDHRADVFAFGCLLYETATGRRPFAGESRVDVLHAILREHPTPAEEVNPEIPSALARLIRRCLAKEPERRAQSMKDLALELREMVDEWEILARPGDSSGSGSTPSRSLPRPRQGRGRAGWLVGAGMAVAVILVVVVLWLAATRTGRKVAPFESMRIVGATSNGRVDAAALSPDGRYLAYTRREPGGTGLWLRQLATGSDVQLLPPSADRAVRNLSVTPDGTFVDYTLSDEMQNVYTLFRIPVLGGRPRKIATDVDTPVSYSPDGRRIAFVRNSFERGEQLIVAGIAGGDEAVLATRNPEEGHGFYYGEIGLGPAWSPDGGRIAVPGWARTGQFHAELVIVDVDAGSQHQLGPETWLFLTGLAWMPDGRALVVAGIPKGRNFAPQLWRESYPDGDIVRITNDSSIYSGVTISTDGSSLATVQTHRTATLWRRSLRGAADERQLTFASREMIGELAGAADGSLVVSIHRDEWSGIARLEPQGGTPIPLTQPDSPSNSPAISRNGRTVVCRSLLPEGRVVLRAMDAEGGNVRNLPERGATYDYALDPDGSSIVVRDETGLWRQPLDGGPASLLVESPLLWPIGFSPDGSRLAYFGARTEAGRPSQPIIAVAPATGGPPTVELERPPGPVDEFRWSPDARSLTFRRREGKGYNVWRLPLDGSPPARITDLDGVALGDYLLSDDGESLTFTKVNTTSDAVLVETFR